MSGYAINPDKQFLRTHFRKIRSLISEKDAALAAESIKKQLLYFISKKYKTPIVIAGYFPIDRELNILPLLKALETKNHKCVMPIITPNKPLEFKKWETGDETELNNNIPEPLAIAPTFIPEIIITPLLACDNFGNRLGYGKGFYDITINHFRKINKKLLVIGLCYKQQIFKQILPTEAHDQKLDLVISD